MIAGGVGKTISIEMILAMYTLSVFCITYAILLRVGVIKVPNIFKAVPVLNIIDISGIRQAT